MIQRILLGGALLGSAAYFCWYNDQDLGYSIVSSSESGYRVVAGSSAPFVAAATLLMAIYIVVLNLRGPASEELRVASMWLRVAAFAADFWSAMLILSGFGSLMAVVIESLRTGTFQWRFQRDYAARSDLFLAIMIFVFLGLLIMYFVFPMMNRHQTIGGWLFRLAVVGVGGTPIALPFRLAVRRIYYEFKGVLHPIRSFKGRDAAGWTWYDRETDVTIMRY